MRIHQYPTASAWAVSMAEPHKVRCITLDKAVDDPPSGSDIFDHGEASVALSRVRKLEGVLLIGLIRASFDKNKTYAHDECARLAAAGCPIS